MDETQAAIQAATITVWGAVTVGVLATMGTIVSALVAPFWIRRAERAEAERRERIAALRQLIPALVDAAVRARFAQSERERHAAEALATVTRIDMWLTQDEWAIARIASIGLLIQHAEEPAKSRAFHAASAILPAWSRGELSADEAKKRFEDVSGLNVVRPWGMDDPSGAME